MAPTRGPLRLLARQAGHKGRPVRAAGAQDQGAAAGAASAEAPKGRDSASRRVGISSAPGDGFFRWKCWGSTYQNLGLFLRSVSACGPAICRACGSWPRCGEKMGQTRTQVADSYRLASPFALQKNEYREPHGVPFAIFNGRPNGRPKSIFWFMTKQRAHIQLRRKRAACISTA